jgi:hypothetical protein
MGAGARWVTAVGVALGLFGACWAGLAEWARPVDMGTDVGLASVPLAVALAVLGPWADRARREKKEAAKKISAQAEHSRQAQVIGEMRGGINIGPGSVVHLEGERSGGTLRAADQLAAEPVVVGDVPQAPAAFQPRAELVEALATGAGVSVVFAVTGQHGVGKTQVAAAYARARIADQWRLVGWVDAADPGSALAGLRAVAAGLRMSSEGEDAGELAAAVRHRLEADGERCLLVFDNASDLDGLRPLLPASGRAQVVITSTRQGAGGLGRAVPVDVFTPEEATRFLSERTGLADQAGAQELAEEVGFLPLALAQAAAVIAREHLGYGIYLERLRSVPVEQYLGRVEGDPYPRGVAQAVLLSLTGIEAGDQGRVCDAVMDLVSVLSAAGVPRVIVQAAYLARALPGVIGPTGEIGVDAALGRLADWSLLTFSVDGAAVIAHRLVMRVVRERRIADGTFAQVVAAAVRVLDELADAAARVWEDPVGVRELAGQIAALGEHAGPNLDSRVAAQVLALRVRGVYLLSELSDSQGQVIQLGVPLVADCQRVLGGDHPDTLTARSNLASGYQEVGRLGEAIPLLEQVLADWERVQGGDHPDTLGPAATWPTPIRRRGGWARRSRCTSGSWPTGSGYWASITRPP